MYILFHWKYNFLGDILTSWVISSMMQGALACYKIVSKPLFCLFYFGFLFPKNLKFIAFPFINTSKSMFSNPEHIFRTFNWPLTYLVEITCLHLSHITTLSIPSMGWDLQSKQKKESALYHHKTQVFRPYEWLSARSLYHRTQVVGSYECLPSVQSIYRIQIFWEHGGV